MGQQELNSAFKAYERACGRDEECRSKGLVPIDLDIVMWNGDVVREKDYKQQFFKIGWEQICD